VHRSWIVVVCLLIASFLVTAGGLGQSTSNDSQGMQALVAEVRQLRKDLQTTNGYALKAQILLSRLQVQEATVTRASEHLNDARGRLADTQHRRMEVTAALKRFEESVDDPETSPANRKQVQSDISMFKTEVENLATEEQQRQTAEMEAEEQLRSEQAKLGGLEDRVDQLEKELGSSPH
jgi:chromosome segregation ATPase